MRMRRKHNLESRLERCSRLLVTNPGELRGKWLQSFGISVLHIELGCGKGRFITETAKRNPDVFFVALEKVANVIVAAMERATREDIKNLRFINLPAENLLDYFAPGEVSRIYINFCDPWPSNRHKKRRLVGGSFLQIYKELLQPGGEIHFKTDNAPLFDFALEEFRSCGFELLETSRNLHGDVTAGENNSGNIMTEYEQKFSEHGVPICFCRAKR